MIEDDVLNTGEEGAVLLVPSALVVETEAGSAPCVTVVADEEDAALEVDEDGSIAVCDPPLLKFCSNDFISVASEASVCSRLKGDVDADVSAPTVVLAVASAGDKVAASD